MSIIVTRGAPHSSAIISVCPTNRGIGELRGLLVHRHRDEPRDASLERVDRRSLDVGARRGPGFGAELAGSVLARSQHAEVDDVEVSGHEVARHLDRSDGHRGAQEPLPGEEDARIAVHDDAIVETARGRRAQHDLGPDAGGVAHRDGHRRCGAHGCAPLTRSTMVDGVPNPPGFVRSNGPSSPHTRLHATPRRDGAADEHDPISEHRGRSVASHDDDGGEAAGLDRSRAVSPSAVRSPRGRPSSVDGGRSTVMPAASAVAAWRERHRVQAPTDDERRRVARWWLRRRTGGLQHGVGGCGDDCSRAREHDVGVPDHAASDHVEVRVGRRVADRAADAARLEPLQPGWKA